jgi:hypothetical protein
MEKRFPRRLMRCDQLKVAVEREECLRHLVLEQALEPAGSKLGVLHRVLD